MSITPATEAAPIPVNQAPAVRIPGRCTTGLPTVVAARAEGIGDSKGGADDKSGVEADFVGAKAIAGGFETFIRPTLYTKVVSTLTARVRLESECVRKRTIYEPFDAKPS